MPYLSPLQKESLASRALIELTPKKETAMTQKLARNLSDPRWCEFWMRVEAAAARARKLHYEEKHRASEASKKPVHPKASTRSKAK